MKNFTLKRVIEILTIVAVFTIAFRTPLDSDLFWHLRVGEWQVENLQVMSEEIYSYTSAGSQWINHSWLSQILLYLTYTATGTTGLAILGAILASGGMFLAYLQCKGDEAIRSLVVIIASAAAAIFWAVRPQLFSFFLAALLLYLLWLYQERESDRLCYVPPLMALWANLHAGFALGFILLLLSIAGHLFGWLFGGSSEPSITTDSTSKAFKMAGRLAVITLVSLVAVCLNPFGYRILLVPFNVVGVQVLQDYIQEWASPDFHLPHFWPFLVLLLGSFLAMGMTTERSSRHLFRWRDALILAGLAYWSLQAARNISIFALAATPILVAHVDALLAGLGYRRFWDRPLGNSFQGVLHLLIVIGAISASIARAYSLASPAAVETAENSIFPVKALAFVREAEVPQQLFNSYNWSGYMLWKAPEISLFADSRTEIYGDDILQSYILTYTGRPGWDLILREEGVNSVFIEWGAPLTPILLESDDWAIAYSDDQAVIFIRTSETPK